MGLHQPGRGDAAARSRRGAHPHGAEFRVWEGGGEYNVARGLRRCFGLTCHCHGAGRQSGWAAGGRSDVQGGVDVVCAMGALRRRRTTCATGRILRSADLGARGAGLLGPRPYCVSRLKPGDIDWDEIFGAEAPDGSTPEESTARFRKRPPGWRKRRWRRREGGYVISYDLNYRESLWKSIGGKQGRQR